uniref:50S ribosomal protein L19, chloroplastic n=1 Tax=Vitrella brassicaformis TaxID=1169539 RepID=A0A7S1JKF8_9ALVE|mmetsp:Transcript_12854/g.30668  ORF Transcript_12854/g.30668 Transcript_12854/m.30668 type:complete len:221 (+) Transcript_12854:37-699(+)
MPRINPGDLVEVRYELSRTQQTFAVFQGYCVEVRLKRSDSSFTLKNVYEGVGVEQLVPRYSPRLLDVRVLKAIPNPQTAQKEPLTRDYRYKWQYNVRGKFTMKQGVHKPGIRSVEPKIRRRLSNIKRRYMHQRVEAGLPPYIWGGPYPQFRRKRNRLIKAEMYRRALIYSLDEQRRRAHRLRRRRQKQKWGVYMIDKEPKITAITALPSYHPLTEGNLPK